MPYKIAIASGKGGTGKTTISVNIFHFMNQISELNNAVRLVDCDVEEPNDLIFFPDAQKTLEQRIFQQISFIDTEKCSFCRQCVEYCEFNAIVVISHLGFAEINPSLCHSCGACLVACHENAIRQKPEEIGKATSFSTDKGIVLTEGKLKVGSAMQTMLIRELKKTLSADCKLILYDAPPGTSCPVVETVSDVDFIILVTEPTPFGVYDLRLMVELLKEMNKDFGVVVNKSGLGNREIYEYLKEENIELLGEIPFDENYASNYAKGRLFEDIPAEIRDSYMKIVHKIQKRNQAK